jgi:hypothetical protein
MSLVKIGYSFIRASDGSVVPSGTECYVYERGTTSLATLYTASAGSTPNPTPVAAGMVQAYVETGASYDLTITVDGESTTVPFEAFLASEVGKPASLNVSTKTAAYAAVSADDVVLADATSTGFPVTLPSAIAFTGQLTIKALATNENLVTVGTLGSQTVDGAHTVTLGSPGSGAPYRAITVVSDGSNWQIV